MYAFVSRLSGPVLRNGRSRDSWDRRRGMREGSCHLAAVSTPVGTGGRKGLGNGRGSGRFGLEGASAKHNTASKDSRLSTIVIGHLGP